MFFSIADLNSMIPHFSGNTEDLDFFIKRCENARDIRTPGEELILIQLIKLKLTVIAEDSVCEKEFHSVNESIDLFEIYFGDEKTIHELYYELSSSKQIENESVLVFGKRIENTGRKITRIAARENRHETISHSEQALLKNFLRGLNYKPEKEYFNTLHYKIQYINGSRYKMI